MYAAERHQRILGRARSEGRVAVRDLAGVLRRHPRDRPPGPRPARAAGCGAAGPRRRGGPRRGRSRRAGRGRATARRRGSRSSSPCARSRSCRTAARYSSTPGSATARLARMLPSGPRLRRRHAGAPGRHAAGDAPGHHAARPRRHGAGARTLAAMGDWIRRSVADVSVDVAFVGTAGVARVHGLTARGPSPGRGHSAPSSAPPPAPSCWPGTPRSATSGSRTSCR